MSVLETIASLDIVIRCDKCEHCFPAEHLVGRVWQVECACCGWKIQLSVLPPEAT